MLNWKWDVSSSTTELCEAKSPSLNKATKKQDTKGPDVHGYLGSIKTLGKKFGFMQEPWITLAVFAAAPANGLPPHATPKDIEAMFKTPKLYSQYLTCTIYSQVPDKYHDLVDWTTFPSFGNNFVKQLNAGRSSAINVLKANFSKILAECEITNKRGDLLYHPGEDRKGPPSAYPPIFYMEQKKNIQTRLLNPVLPMALRCMIFGPASIGDKGNVKPLNTTLGYLWQLPAEGLTIGSLSFTLTAIISVLSGVDTQFEEKGKISGIPFQTYFRGYKKLLMKTAETPGVRNILRFWTKAVFKKVAAAVSLDEAVPDDEAEAAAEAEFAAAMEAMALGEDPAVAFDWSPHDIDNAAALEPGQQLDDQRQDIDNTEEPEPEPELEEEERVPVAAARRRGAGRARGGAVVLDSDEDLVTVGAVPEPRRGGRRGVAVPAAVEEPDSTTSNKLELRQKVRERMAKHRAQLKALEKTWAAYTAKAHEDAARYRAQHAEELALNQAAYRARKSIDKRGFAAWHDAYVKRHPPPPPPTEELPEWPSDSEDEHTSTSAVIPPPPPESAPYDDHFNSFLDYKDPTTVPNYVPKPGQQPYFQRGKRHWD
ncbi:hypothetical protein C8F04DRAFT_1256034 [Mycena alexandri]|uniref:Uncharacterized protein n=1 Tax=Mycena alexandri TaxID=1745969 RepID=A0AAD6X7M8_9AGAR|nr:hypothetical protein C8F04DRAFT_1256034 [Mycena alexandri]